MFDHSNDACFALAASAPVSDVRTASCCLDVPLFPLCSVSLLKKANEESGELSCLYRTSNIDIVILFGSTWISHLQPQIKNATHNSTSLNCILVGPQNAAQRSLMSMQQYFIM